MAQRQDIERHLHTLLAVESFKDYGPNGLQVEGRAEVRCLVSGVTASLAFIDEAIRLKADAVLVHHGLFWRGQDGRLRGWLAERVRRLMRHDINLFAYHLPLDAHATLGNNAQLGRVLGWQPDARFGDQALGMLATVDADLTATVAHVETTLGRAATAVPGDGRRLKRVAWCTGGAQGHFEDAIAAGADLYVTGEISEPQAHLARETGVAFLACGHHATERYGAPAVGAHLADCFGLEHHVVDVPNPA